MTPVSGLLRSRSHASCSATEKLLDCTRFSCRRTLRTARPPHLLSIPSGLFGARHNGDAGLLLTTPSGVDCPAYSPHPGSYPGHRTGCSIQRATVRNSKLKLKLTYLSVREADTSRFESGGPYHRAAEANRYTWVAQTDPLPRSNRGSRTIHHAIRVVRGPGKESRSMYALILKLDVAVQPVGWLSRHDGALLYCREQIAWEAG